MGSRAKKRGLPQLGTLGAGNHYAEIQVRWLVRCRVIWGRGDMYDSEIDFPFFPITQVVEEILDPRAAARMGIDQIGQVRWLDDNSKERISDIHRPRQR